jgi:hypothetical protein
LEATEIKDRFLREQSYVERYVMFLRNASAVAPSEVTEISNLLREYSLGVVPTRQSFSEWRKPYSADELASVANAFRAILPAIESRIDQYERQLSQLPEPQRLRDIDVRSDLGELITFICQYLEHDSSPEAVESARQQVLEQQAEYVREYGDDAEPLASESIDYAIQSALFILAQRRLSDVLYLRARYADIDLASRMSQPEAEINILRQGFILLLTAFDAAIFDLVRVALTRNFFGLIAAFGNKDKISLESLARYGSFQVLRDEVIEDQLKSRYLKDLLFLLNDLGVQCTDEASGKRLIALIEVVMRRNLHVHNRGVVDERYLERDQNSQPRFNLYNLALGTTAHIDENYWNSANELCQYCVEQVAMWANSQVLPKEKLSKHCSEGVYSSRMIEFIRRATASLVPRSASARFLLRGVLPR